MLETVREFALEQAGNQDELGAFRQRHAAYYLGTSGSELASVGAASRISNVVRRVSQPSTVARLVKALGMTTGDAPLSQRRLRGSSRSDGALRHLPHFATSFIGREAQLEEVVRLLAETRLLTLVGPGGIGKTRLAVAAAGAATSFQVDGVAFADLSALLDARLVVQAVAAALGLEEQPGRSLREAVLEWLRTRYVLLVLDNCEHVIQDCAELVEQLLQRCSQLRILATSREPMALAGETVWRVPSLGLPDLQQMPTLEAMLGVEAVRLFVERARAVQTNFELTQLNSRAVADICVQLDGIPLAIELAAAQTHLLSAQELRMRLSHPLQVLTRGTRLAPGRQRTIRATLDWSYELLSDAEKLLLGRLSVFSGSWPLSGAEAICAGEGIANDEVLDLLGRLLDKSLLRVEQDGDEQRYRLLEPVRQYAAERLDQTGETDRIRDRHQKWCLALLEEAEPEWFGPRQTVWLARLDREHDNLRAAMAWSLTEDADIEAGLRLGAFLWRFWDMRSYLSEGTDYLRRLLLRPGTDPYPRARAQALMVLGYLETIRGDHTQARTVITEAERYWRSINDNRALAVTLFYAGLLSAWSQTDIEPAEALLTASLSLARSHGPVWTTYFTLMRLGDLARLRGDGERAQELLEESRQLTEAANDGWGQARCLHSLGQVRLMRGDADEARRLLVDSLSSGDRVRRSPRYQLRRRWSRVRGSSTGPSHPGCPFVW